MKKLIFALCLLLNTAFIFANPLAYIKDASYAYYIDQRYDLIYAKGYLVCHNSDGTSYVFLNMRCLSAPFTTNAIILFEEDENHNLNSKSIRIDETIPETEKQILFQSITDIFNFDSMYRHNQDRIGTETILEDKWDTYSLYYKFGKAIPGFKFLSISMNDPECKTTKMYAHSFGTIPSNDTAGIAAFMNKEIEIFTPETRDLLTIVPEKPSKKVNLSGKEFILDESWKKNEVDGNESWWLQVNTIRDAQIMVESFPDSYGVNTIENRINFARLIPLYIQNIIPVTIKMAEEGNDLVVSYETYDEANIVSYNFQRYTENKIINFSAFKDVYEQNEEYFSKLLDGIKPE